MTKETEQCSGSVRCSTSSHIYPYVYLQLTQNANTDQRTELVKNSLSHKKGLCRRVGDPVRVVQSWWWQISKVLHMAGE